LMEMNINARESDASPNVRTLLVNEILLKVKSTDSVSDVCSKRNKEVLELTLSILKLNIATVETVSARLRIPKSSRLLLEKEMFMMEMPVIL